MAHTIKTTGEIAHVEPKEGGKFSLEELQGFVGGYIELVRVTRNRFMFVNEEGRLIGLPVNLRASFLANQVIVGDVVVCESTEVED